ncbi:MAG: 16S rRNA (cytosine(1402)-N(4))-methyltransferase RsmH [Bacteroidales bacterium]|nr:16S rRNA (cytosine(1402)-N(4))-methyltransferase RsmH [Bacteroidales bacterium]
MSQYHTPVMLRESISALVGNPEGLYVDATFGGGGHTAAILSRLLSGGRVIAFDRDVDASENAPRDKRFTLVQSNFRFVENFLELLAPGSKADGILADLGVSSHQFDTAERGFSFRFDAPLDMRMSSDGERTAADVIADADEEELGRILKVYGEVDGAQRMARAIVRAREASPIRTTAELNAAVEAFLPKGAEHKVLSKVYQALRIEVNEEMRSLEKFLDGAAASLKEGGKLVVITYHSLEDRMVKNFIREREDMAAVNRKPILPSEEEIASNTRSRSAKLRIAEKITDRGAGV